MRTTNGMFFFAAIAVAALLLTVQQVHGFAKNRPIAPNDLGDASMECSALYCGDTMDSLSLWMTMQKICHPADEGVLGTTRRQLAGNSGMFSHEFTQGESGIICAVTSVVGLLAGFYMGKKYFPDRAVGYTVIPQGEKDIGDNGW